LTVRTSVCGLILPAHIKVPQNYPDFSSIILKLLQSKSFLEGKKFKNSKELQNILQRISNLDIILFTDPNNNLHILQSFNILQQSRHHGSCPVGRVDPLIAPIGGNVN
jgi:hypothetical protein